MPSKRLIIVESPTKARTIEKFLGKEFEVLASYGHVRDLPNNAAEIPAQVKKEKWSRLGINVDANFDPLYIVPENKKKHVAELKKAVKECSEVLLATDEDREGESISWHLLEVLAPKVPVHRMVFHEITKDAIKQALDSPRKIDENLVKAQETRRIIDRLFGYSVSPLLWKKMAPRLSAGRVQSVAIRLLVQRERERINFRESNFWDLKAKFSKAGSQLAGDEFDAELTHVDDTRVASGKDFDPNTGKLLEKANVKHLDEKAAHALRERLSTKSGIVSSIEEKPYTTRPPAPFTTSTLQQEASAKLGFAARRTMAVAQMLYENGVITYMRTDSTNLSEEALTGARNLIQNEFGKEFLYPEPRIYKTKVKNAQEAHEAVRPAGTDFMSPIAVREKFGVEAFKLYELIWQRTVASQMKDATGMRIVVQIKCENAQFRASGKTISFAGYLRAYVEGSDDPEGDLADREKILPKMEVGETLDLRAMEALSHVTQPPARYTEGSLIKELERLGIGRPSTWATIVDVVLSRTYAFKKGTALVPSFLATAVTGLMERYFTTLTDYEFTANLEDDLDAISRGEADNLKYLKKFYFGNGHAGLNDLVRQGEEKIDPRDVCGIAIGQDKDGTPIEVRIGRYGPFVSNGTARASLPDALPPDELTLERAVQLLVDAAKGPEALGKDPTTGEAVYLKKGRFGPYVQRGEMVEGGEKPKMASLLPGMSPDDVNLEMALKLLQFPKLLGKNPENNEDVFAATGRYGPYIKCGSDTRSIPTDQISPLEIDLEKAMELLKQPKTRGRSGQPKMLREVGKHPTSGVSITLRSGRYGPYVTDGTVNASLSQGADPAELTLEEAINLLEVRAAKMGNRPPKKKGGAKKKAEKAPAEKKTAKKKGGKKKKAAADDDSAEASA